MKVERPHERTTRFSNQRTHAELRDHVAVHGVFPLSPVPTWVLNPKTYRDVPLNSLVPRESVGSVCTWEQLTRASARYACSEERDHECKPSPHRHTSASTSGEKAGQAAGADCGSTGDRPGCARSKAAANLFTIPLDDERETASSGCLARSAR